MGFNYTREFAPFRAPKEPNDLTRSETRGQNSADPAGVFIGPMDGIRPSYNTPFSAGNDVRRGVVAFMTEWWRYRKIMTGDYFVSTAGVMQRQAVHRAMARSPRFDKVIPNRRTFYRAEEYGETRHQEKTEDAVVGAGLPSKKIKGGRFRRG